MLNEALLCLTLQHIQAKEDYRDRKVLSLLYKYL